MQYIDEIAILYGGNEVTISAVSAEGARFQDVQGQVIVNEEELPEAVMSITLDDITITRTRHAVRVQIPGQLDASMEIARAAYWAGSGPGENFINFRLSYLKASKEVHGVLGQTYRETAGEQPRPGATRRQRVAQRDGLLVMGAAAEGYETTSLLAPDCTFASYDEVAGQANQVNDEHGQLEQSRGTTRTHLLEAVRGFFAPSTAKASRAELLFSKCSGYSEQDICK
eukprot:jgi/Mesen1/10787/ME000091S10305